MATADRKELDIIMRAQFQGKETLDGVVKTITSLDEAIKKQAEAAKRGEVSLDQLKATALALQQAQERLKNVGGLTGEYEKLSGKVNETAGKVETARQKFEAFRATIDSVGVPTESQTKKFAALGKSFDDAANRLAKQKEQLAALEAELGRAGIATDKLTEASDRARRVAAESAVSYQRVQDSIKNYAIESGKASDAVSNAAKSHSLFNDSGRTTLSLLQRIRGEVLSVTASYVGLYGAMAGGSKVIEAYNTKQGILNQLSISTGGDPRAAAAEFEYVRNQALRLGIDLETAAKGYAKFSAAATMAGRSQQEVRHIFESFSEVGRVANLTKDEMDGIFKALEQMMSKGKIQAEELRGQLGDRLFGAFQVAAKALKDQFPDLDKAMQNGLVTSEQLVLIAEEYRKTVAGQLPTALKSLQANQERLNTSIFDFKTAVADAGFANGFAAFVSELTTFFNSNDGKKFAKDISDALSTALDLVKTLLENLNAVKLVLELIATFLAVKFIASAGAAFVQAIKWARELQLALLGITAVETAPLLMQLTTLTGAIRILGLAAKAAFPVITAFMVGFEFGTFLYNQSEAVRKYSQMLVAYLDYLVTGIGGYSRAAKEFLSGNVSGARKMVEDTKAEMRAIQQMFNDLRDGKYGDVAPGSKVAAPAPDGQTPMPDGAAARGRTDRQKAIDAKLSELETSVKRKSPAAMSNIAANYDSLYNDIQALGGREADALMKRLENLHNKQIAAENKFGEKRIALKQQIEERLANMQAASDAKQSDDLGSKLKSLDERDKKLLDDINRLGGVEGQKLKAAFDAIKGQNRQTEIDSFWQKLVQDTDKAANEAGRKAGDLAEKILAANNEISAKFKPMYEAGASYRAEMVRTGGDTRQVDARMAGLQRDEETLKQLAQKKILLDELAAKEKEVSDLIAARDAKIAAENTLREVGARTEADALKNTIDYVNTAQPAIEQAYQSALAFAEANKASFDPEVIAKYRAELEKMRQSGKNIVVTTEEERKVVNLLVDGAMKGFESITKSIGGAIMHMNSWKDVTLAVRNAFLQFAADFLMQIAQMILKTQILNALGYDAKGNKIGGAGGQSGGGGGGGSSEKSTWVSIAMTAISAWLGGGSGGGASNHVGGVVGQSGAPRSMHSSWFSNAPRYHTGGIAGLAPNEVPTILQKNEEVLSTTNPRNILNGGAAAGGKASQANLKVVNMIDSASVVSEGLASPSGEQVMMNFIRANKTGIKMMLG